MTFYDIQVSKHPSYHVHGIPVHNCHQYTREAQSACLKMLEDPPSHAHYIFATTDPGKLIRTFRTRCTEIELKPLTDDAVREIIREVADKEKTTVSDRVVNLLVEAAQGSARKALVDLQAIHGMPEAAQLEAIQPPKAERAAFDVVRAILYEDAPWPKIAKVIHDLDENEDWDGIRRLIVVCASNELLAGKSADRACAIVSYFELMSGQHYPDGKLGRASLCRAAYEVSRKK